MGAQRKLQEISNGRDGKLGGDATPLMPQRGDLCLSRLRSRTSRALTNRVGKAKTSKPLGSFHTQNSEGHPTCPVAYGPLNETMSIPWRDLAAKTGGDPGYGARIPT